MDKLEAMQTFIEVAKQSSFSHAAIQLGRSAPTVTRTIAALEDRLKVKLFNRTTRHVRLTDSGALFLEDAKRIIENLEEAEAAVKGIYTKPSGKLTITAPVLFGEQHIMPIITAYLDVNPDVAVKALYYDRVISLLEEEVNVVIRIGHLKDANLYAKKVGEVRRVVCGSPLYFKKYGKPQKPRDLIQHNVILASTSDRPNTWQFLNQGKKQTVTLTSRLQCNQNGAVLNAAKSGFGITRLMSYQVGDDIEKGLLQSILTDYEEAPIPVNIVHLEGHRMNAKTRSFIDLAVDLLRQNPVINPIN